MLSTVLFCLLVASVTGLIVVTWLWRDSLAEQPTTKNAVENLESKVFENGDVRFTWDPPPKVGHIDLYFITVSSNDVDKGTYSTKNTDYNFTDLEACSSYKFVFNARKDHDKKTKFKPVVRSLDTANKAPGTPEILQISSKTDVITWTRGKLHPNCVRGYNLKFFHDKICIKDVLLPKENDRYKFTDINSCSRYVVTLQALGVTANLSSGLAEKEINSSWSDYKQRTFVNNIRYEIVSRNQVVVKWETAPDLETCIHDFVLSFFDANGFQVFTTDKHEQLISNLNVCSRYRVTVTPRTQHREFLGKSNEIIVKTKTLVPESVTTLDVVSNAQGSILLYWLGPVVNGDCVDTYQVNQTGGNSSLIKYTKKTYTEINMKLCTRYLFSVSAMNSQKESSEPVTVKYFHVPEGNQIANVNFVEENNGLVVKWRTSVYENECFELFSVEICALDHDVSCRSFKPRKRVGNSELSVFIPNIIPCVTYKISISLVDADRQYAFISEIYHSNTKAFDKPVYQNRTNVTSHFATLKWRIPDLQKNRCALLGSRLECIAENKRVMTFLYNSSRSSEIVTDVANLKPYTNYTCTLSLQNLAGASPKSDNVEFRTLEDVPSHPTELSAVDAHEDRLNISWKPPSNPNGVLNKYQLEVRASRLLYTLPSWCHFKPDFVWTTTISEESNNYEIEKLSPFTEYIVSISAASGVGFGDPIQKKLCTAPAAPSAVTQPQYLSTSPLCYTITWKQPCRTNGILKSFQVEVEGSRNLHSDDNFSWSVLANVSNTDYLYSVRLPKLRPVYNYKIEISAKVENVSENGEISSLEFVTPASLPPVPLYESLVEKVQPTLVPGRNGTALKLTLSKDMFNDSSGEILYYAIIVGQDISFNNKMENGDRLSPNDWPVMTKWAEASQFDFVFAYQVTPPFWNPFKGKTDRSSIEFVVGDNVECQIPSQSYCNGPLKPETKYSIRFRAFTAAGYQDSPALKMSTGSETLITARTNYILVVGVLLLLGFVVCGLYYVKSGQMYLLDRMIERTMEAVMRTKKISIREFSQHFHKLQKSPHILKMEFNELTETSAKFNNSDNVGKREDNIEKNRYTNIVPYDETRVKIQSEKGDYINASFIQQGEHKNRYIATQGPSEETFGDFWTMILQYDVNIIIMLCQVIENNRIVCDQYFPEINQTLEFDSISVECTMSTSTELYEERQITVTKGNKKLIVNHIKFLEWPDFGTPADPQTLVDFCCGMRKRYTASPVVIHCSAGVGRTGTFIACDILLQIIKKSKSVNIYGTVLKLRKQRPHMVQSLAQYVYLYACINYAITKLNTDENT